MERTLDSVLGERWYREQVGDDDFVWMCAAYPDYEVWEDENGRVYAQHGRMNNSKYGYSLEDTFRAIERGEM